MRLISKIITGGSLIFCCHSMVSGQNMSGSLLNKITTFEKYYEGAHTEKLFLHTDRDVYVTGEHLWYAAHLLNKKSAIANHSKVAYVELLNAQNKPVVQQKIPFREIAASGGFKIPDSLTSGVYILRAYTKRLKTFGPAHFFRKPIRVLNPFKETQYLSNENRPQYTREISVGFHPEGGTLVAGLKSRIGIKVMDSFSVGVPVEGTVRNEAGDTVAKVQCDASGYGIFELVPERANSYKLGFSVDGKLHEFPLPQSEASGFVIRTSRTSKGFLKVEVGVDEQYVAANGRNYYFVVQTRGSVDFQDNRQLTENRDMITIPNSFLTPGINQIALFDQNGKLLAQRLIYTPFDKPESIQLITVDTYRTRQKAELQLELEYSDIPDFPALSLSVSVPGETDHISGFMENYFVQSEFSNLVEAWDLMELIRIKDAADVEKRLIGMHSYLYNWETSDKLIDFQRKDTGPDGVYLTGTLIQRGSGTPIENKLLYLSVPGTTTSLKYARTDKQGAFKFLMPDQAGVSDLVIQVANGDQEDFRISVDNPFSLDYLETGAASLRIHEKLLDKASDWSVNYQLEQIYHDSIIPPEEPEKIRAENFYGRVDKSLNLDDFITLPVLEEVFYELIYGVRLKKTGSDYRFILLDPVFNTTTIENPAVFIDGVMVFDVNRIAEMHPEEFQRIDVVRDKYQLGDIVLNGIVSLYTRDGDFSIYELPASAVRRYYPLYNSVGEFYSPHYSEKDPGKARIPDLRNTLYWDPNVRIDEQGKATIEFYTSDFHSDYVIVVEGITEKGDFISVRKTITVK